MRGERGIFCITIPQVWCILYRSMGPLRSGSPSCDGEIETPGIALVRASAEVGCLAAGLAVLAGLVAWRRCTADGYWGHGKPDRGPGVSRLGPCIRLATLTRVRSAWYSGFMEGAPSIADWPEEDRPRERLYHKGAEALADAELVAIQLGAGVRGTNAVELAREMLVRYGSLSGLAGRDVAELAGIRGVGRAKAVRLASAFELTRRLRSRNGGGRIVLSSPEQVYARYGPLMEDLEKEVFRVALLDAQNGLVKDVVVSEGTLSASLVHPREVFKPAILESAASLILLHNHPSGDPTPSREDIRLTRQLVECGRLLDLRIHDHVVIGRGRFASLAERGAL